MISKRTPATHPWACEVWTRSDTRRSHCIGLMLFETKESAEAYSADCEDDDSWCNVVKAKASDKEFA